MSEDATPNKPEKPNVVWKYFGAALMENKGGHSGIGFTRLLTLLVFAIMAFGFIKKIMDTGEIDAQLIYVFAMLVGAKGAKDGVNAWKGNGNGSNGVA